MNDSDLLAMDKKQLVELVKLAITFKNQHVGKRPEAFRRYIESLVKNMHNPITFMNLVYELELAAVRRKDKGELGEPIESVNRVWQTVIFHDKKGRRIHKAFGTVRNCLTEVKKDLSTTSPKR